MPDSGCALVTGSSRGIGAAVATTLAAGGWPVGVNFNSDEAGARAVVEAIEATGGAAVAVQGDASDPAAVANVFDELESRFERVSILVNNAGMRADGLAPQLRDAQWQDVLQTNLSASFWTSRRALRRMIRARFGRIVNIASVVGPCVGNPGQANYAAAKAGLVGLTRTMAREVAHRGVTVNAVAPGFVQTRMTEDVGASFLEAIPARRAGTPEEIAACVRFLVSPEAAYVTGTTLVADGGMTA